MINGEKSNYMCSTFLRNIYRWSSNLWCILLRFQKCNPAMLLYSLNSRIACSGFNFIFSCLSCELVFTFQDVAHSYMCQNQERWLSRREYEINVKNNKLIITICRSQRVFAQEISFGASCPSSRSCALVTSRARGLGHCWRLHPPVMSRRRNTQCSIRTHYGLHCN